MRKNNKPVRKDKKERVQAKKEDKDIYLNVIGVPVTNVKVDKKLERQPASDFHMYRISIDTSSRSSRETKDRRSIVSGVQSSPRAASTPPMMARVQTIPSDSSSTGSDVNYNGPRSVSTTAIKTPEPAGGRDLAPDNARDKQYPGSNNVKPAPPSKKGKDAPVVCYTEEKRPVRIVGRLKTPDDDKGRHRRSTSKRKNSKQVEFSDRNAVYDPNHEEFRKDADHGKMPYKEVFPQVYRAHDKTSKLFDGAGSKNDPNTNSLNTNQQTLTMSQPNKKLDKGNIVEQKESSRSISPKSKAFDDPNTNASSSKPDTQATQSFKNAPPRFIPQTYSNESAKFPITVTNQPNMKPVNSSIAEAKESTPNKNMSPELRAGDNPTSKAYSNKPDPHSYSRTVNATQPVKNAAPEYIPTSQSSSFTKHRANPAHITPVKSSIAEQRTLMPAKSLSPESMSFNGPKKDASSYIPDSRSYSRTVIAIPSIKNTTPVFKSATPSVESTRDKNDFPTRLATQLNPENQSQLATRDKLTSAADLPVVYNTAVSHKGLNRVDANYAEGKPADNHENKSSEIPSKMRETTDASTGTSAIEPIGNKRFNLQNQPSSTAKGTNTQDLRKCDPYLMPSTSKGPTKPTSLFQDSAKGQQVNNGIINNELHYQAPSQDIQYQPSPETVNGLQNTQTKRIQTSPLSVSKRSSKESAGSSRGPIDRSPSRVKYTSTPLVTSIPKPNFRNTKYTYTLDTRNSSNIFAPQQKATDVQKGKRGLSKTSSIDPDADENNRSINEFPVTIDYDDFKSSVQTSPERYLAKFEPTNVETRSVEISHRTYGGLSSADTMGGTTKLVPLDDDFDKKTVHESFHEANINYRDPRDSGQVQTNYPLPKNVHNKQQDLGMSSEPILPGSYIPTRPLSTSINNVGSFQNRSDTHPFNSVDLGKPGTSSANDKNVHPTYSVSPSTRFPDHKDFILETHGADKKAFRLNDTPSVDTFPRKRSVDENLFENKINPNYAGVGPNSEVQNNDSYLSPSDRVREFPVEKGREDAPYGKSSERKSIVDEGGEKGPLDHWSAVGSNNPEVFAYLGHVDPMNPFDHKTNDGLPENYAEDHSPNFIPEYIENDRLVPGNSAEVPVTDERLTVPVLSSEDNTFSRSPSYRADFKPITKVDTKRSLIGFNPLRQIETGSPIGRSGRTSKRSMPTIDTILEEEIESGTDNATKPSLNEGEKMAYDHNNNVVEDGLRGEPTAPPAIDPQPADDGNPDSMEHGYEPNNQLNSDRDLFAYLGEFGNANPFGHKGGDEYTIDNGNPPERTGNIEPDYKGIGALSKDGDLAESHALDNEKKPPDSPSHSIQGKRKKSKLKSKPVKGPPPLGKAKRKSQDGNGMKYKNDHDTIVSQDSDTDSYSKAEAVFLGKIPNTAMNVFYSINDEQETLPAKGRADSRELGDGQKITEGPKGILIFVNKKNDSDKSPFEDPNRLSKNSPKGSKNGSDVKKQRKQDKSPTPSKGGKHPSDGKTVVEKDGSATIVKKEYPCGCVRMTNLDRNNELVGEDLISVACRDGSKCKVRLPTLQKHDRVLSMDESRKGSSYSGRGTSDSKSSSQMQTKPSGTFPEIEVVADGIVSKKPIELKPPKPSMRGAKLTGTINLKSNKFNGVCHLYLQPKLKDYLRKNMHILQELLERDDNKS